MFSLNYICDTYLEYNFHNFMKIFPTLIVIFINNIMLIKFLVIELIF